MLGILTINLLIERQTAIARHQIACQHERPGSRRRGIPLRVLDDDPRAGRRQAIGMFEGRVQQPAAVGRIEEHDVDWREGRLRCRACKVNADNSIAPGDAAVLEIRLDEPPGAPIVLDEGDVRRASAERFEPDGAGARISVHDARADDTIAEHVEQRLAKLVRRRTQTVPIGGFQTPALEGACDDSHVETRIRNKTRITRITQINFTVSCPRNLCDPRLVPDPRLADSNEAEALLPARTHERRELARARLRVEGNDGFAARFFHELMIAQQIADAQRRHA